MVWKQIEATPPHVTYLLLSTFLIFYALFSLFIRNRLHLSEPPLALLAGIIFGPRGAGVLNPLSWGLEDDITQEFTRVILGIQVFVVGLELPKHYIKRHWRSILYMLGPVMTFGWVICAVFIKFLLNTDIPTALVISACLTPTDPVLAASVLNNSQFSARVPRRIKLLLSCESGCNDGVSFPFLYVGLAIMTKNTVAASIKEWACVTVLYQCILGVIIGATIGYVAHILLRYADERKLIGSSAFVVFYLLLAILSIGVASTLGLDDFLVAFFAGVAFSYDGWFAEKTSESDLNEVLDLMINSTFFVYFGAIIPWETFSPRDITPDLTPSRLVAVLILVLLFRRIPVVLALKTLVPDIKTYSEALFCGHFGPMGVGAVFLAIEARAQLETHTSHPLPRPDPASKDYKAIELVWPVISFIVLGSTMVHGLSVAATSVIVHFNKEHHKRSSTIGGEVDPLEGMIHEDNEASDEEDADSNDEGGRISLPH